MAQYCYYNANTNNPIHRVNFNGNTYRKVAVSLSNVTKTFTLETWYSYSASAFPYSYTDYTLHKITNTKSANYTYYYYSGQARYTNNYNAWDTPFETFDLSIYSYKTGTDTIWGFSQRNNKTPVFVLPNFMPFSTSSTTYHWKYTGGDYSISRAIDGRFSVLCTIHAYAGGSMSVPLANHGEETWQPVYGGNGHFALATSFEYSLPSGITNASEYFTELRDSYRYDGTKATAKRAISAGDNPQHFERNTF